MTTMATIATSIPLADGYRADWEDNGNRLAMYGPMVQGYRLLTVWAELSTYVPAWGTRRDTVTEWCAYRDWQSRIPLGSRPVESFDSPEAIVAWLESLARREA